MIALAGSKPEEAFIGLGSNLQDPVQQLRRALTEMDALPDTRLLKVSSFYRSPPMEGSAPGQPDYINAVAWLETALNPSKLLQALLQIEQRHGRTRSQHWGARTLDLDLLLYAQTRINEPELVVPHPGLHKRAFVLYPLYEIAPVIEIPGLGALQDLLAGCGAGQLEKLTIEK
ncbi:MAG TPA: 2-amino-4-hydroxy-6-hydroxymethyldihydropteridine diphosphokinase [Gammaproteobacteria bacterium]